MKRQQKITFGEIRRPRDPDLLPWPSLQSLHNDERRPLAGPSCLEIFLDSRGLAAFKHVLEQRQRCAQPAQADAHLVHAFRVGAAHGGLVRGDLAQAFEGDHA